MGIVYRAERREREAEIETCFSCEFDYPKGLEKFADLLEDFKAHSNAAKATNTYLLDEEDIVNSGFREKTNLDQLIFMENNSGLADESK